MAMAVRSQAHLFKQDKFAFRPYLLNYAHNAFFDFEINVGFHWYTQCCLRPVDQCCFHQGADVFSAVILYWVVLVSSS